MNSLKREHPNTKHVQSGRGGKRGKTAGRGTKGQNARSGHRKRPELRDLIKKIPKKRGYGKNRSASAFDRGQAFTVNLAELDKSFDAGATVSASTLVEKGLASSKRALSKGIKILGKGDVTKSLIISGCAISDSAKAKIEAAGGTVE